MDQFRPLPKRVGTNGPRSGTRMERRLSEGERAATTAAGVGGGPMRTASGSDILRMEHAQTGEEEVPQDLFFGVSIEEIDNATMYQYDMYLGSASVGSQDYHLTHEESLQPSPMSGKKQAREKRVACRGTAFTKEEDSILCSAYLNISKDPITGVNQNMDAYYKRIYDYYHEHKPEGSIRSQISLQKGGPLFKRLLPNFVD